ncbi:hypothetical protein OH805_06965 [Streptomyces sp. NBC_00879]|uniref:hypothetical protein n=1 Tax=Streptomyces sp. NBC_00879 TaxID=2975855 RepID=UPI00386B4E92|nr:hypothetical protein OH805_06965 [Streptomyces sp. NBC_00879]
MPPAREAEDAHATALVEALAEHAPEVRLTGLAAGFHAVAHLPVGADEQSVIAARARSVGLYGMSPHPSSGARDPAQLVLGFGNLGERTVREGIAAVAGILRATAQSGTRPGVIPGRGPFVAAWVLRP